MIEGNHHQTDNQILASERDAILQLFIERKLSASQVYAARRWQEIMERATLQPNTSIDWSTNNLPRQARGTVTQRQWNAMKVRQQFRDEHGPSLMGLLDYCLGPDRGRAELIRAFRTDDANLVELFENLLSKLAGCIGISLGGYRQPRFWRMA